MRSRWRSCPRRSRMSASAEPSRQSWTWQGRPAMPRLTGGQIVAETLAREGVPYLLAVPGHGNVALLDAFLGRDDVRVLHVVHEQCAVHIADAFYRVSGRPIAVSTSIGPGAVNAAAGLAQCYVDSSAVLLI